MGGGSCWLRCVQGIAFIFPEPCLQTARCSSAHLEPNDCSMREKQSEDSLLGVLFSHFPNHCQPRGLGSCYPRLEIELSCWKLGFGRWRAVKTLSELLGLESYHVCAQVISAEEVAVAHVFASGSQVRPNVHLVTYRSQKSLSLGFGFVKFTQ